MTFPVVFSLVVGIAFFSGDAPSGWQKSLIPIPHAEFLLVRPLSRRQVYFVRVALYFVVMLATPLLDLALRSRHPDLEFSLYKSKTQSTEASDKLSLYQAAFPRSFIVTKEKASHPTLVIPDGNRLVGAWQLLMTMAVALGVQTIAALRPPARLQGPFFIGFLAIITALSLPTLKSDWKENAFLAFVRHWDLAFLLAAAVFCLFQMFAGRQVRRMEVE